MFHPMIYAQYLFLIYLIIVFPRIHPFCLLNSIFFISLLSLLGNLGLYLHDLGFPVDPSKYFMASQMNFTLRAAFRLDSSRKRKLSEGAPIKSISAATTTFAALKEDGATVATVEDLSLGTRAGSSPTRIYGESVANSG